MARELGRSRHATEALVVRARAAFRDAYEGEEGDDDPTTDPLEVLRLPSMPLAPDPVVRRPPAGPPRHRPRPDHLRRSDHDDPDRHDRHRRGRLRPDPRSPPTSSWPTAVPARRLVRSEVFGGTRGETVEMPDGRLGHAEVHIGPARC